MPLPITYPPEKLVKYPHFVRMDAAIWTRYLEIHKHEYERFLYDVRVGRGVPVDGATPPKYRGMWHHLTQKRIDVIGFKPGEIVIIEVRTNATVAAPGNLTAYKHLYTKDYAPPEPVSLLLITNRYDEDVSEVCAAAGISYEVV